MHILLIHGPNLNLLGTREPAKYGTANSENIVAYLQSKFPDCNIAYFQSNAEGELVNAIQKAKDHYQGLLINAGGLSHSSISIADAIRSTKLPCISIHIQIICFSDQTCNRSRAGGCKSHSRDGVLSMYY